MRRCHWRTGGTVGAAHSVALAIAVHRASGADADRRSHADARGGADRGANVCPGRLAIAARLGSATPPPWPAHHRAGTRIGVAEVDTVIVALEAGDVDGLVGLALVQELACVPRATLPGIGALICEQGERPEVPLRVFQSSQCEGLFVREARLAEHLAFFADAFFGVYAVVEVQEPRRARGFGSAAPWDYVIAVTTCEQPAPGFAGGQAALVGAGGAVIATNVGCNTPSAFLAWGGEPPALLLPPPAP